MVLTDRDKSIPANVVDSVRIAALLAGCYRLWSLLALPAVDALVGEIDEVDGALAHQEGSSPILVDPGAGVERHGCHISGASLRAPADDHIPAALAGAGLDPVHVVAVEGNLAEGYGAGGDQVRGDGGLPGAVRG